MANEDFDFDFSFSAYMLIKDLDYTKPSLLLRHIIIALLYNPEERLHVVGFYCNSAVRDDAGFGGPHAQVGGFLDHLIDFFQGI
mmetsp:Transcript_3224/g.5699  ORF Transcript_3224/g.5699 Transcript_3224/m.5699 type:complete len:84 (+) Transcript_3224:80-331(+)